MNFIPIHLLYKFSSYKIVQWTKIRTIWGPLNFINKIWEIVLVSLLLQIMGMGASTILLEYPVISKSFISIFFGHLRGILNVSFMIYRPFIKNN